MAESDPVHTGKTEGFDEPFTRLHKEIARRAHFGVANEAAHSMETQDLVNEVYLKLRDSRAKIDPDDEEGFKRLVTRNCRFVLVDRAKRRKADKRGGGVKPQQFDEMLAGTANESAGPSEVLLVDTALEKLADEYPEHAGLIEQKYFGGFTVEKIAEDLGVSRHVIDRKLKFGMASLKDIILLDIGG